MWKKKRVFFVILLILIIIFQVLVKINIANKKSYLHIDEGYSYGLMNYDKVEFIQNDDFFNKWHDAEYFLDYLTVNSDELWNFSAVYENQKNDVHPPLFYLLLNICAGITPDSFNMWPAISLNILIFILSIIVLYLLAKEVFKSRIFSLIVCFAFGFSIASTEGVIFIRMYLLAMLNILILSYLHVRNYNKIKLDLKSLLLIGFFAIIGSLTHYYNIIFLGVLFLIYIIRYIYRRKWENAIKYFITIMISAVVSLSIFPYSIAHMFLGYRGAGIIDSLSDLQTLLISLAKYFYIVHSQVFNHMLMFMIFIGIVCILILIVKKGKIVISVKNKKMILIAIPTMIYLIIVASGSPYQEIRYILPICPLIVLMGVYYTKKLLEKLMSQKVLITTMVLMAVVISILPVIIEFKVEYLYKNLGKFVYSVENEYKNLPTIYVFEKSNNRFMDDIYIFSKIEESYIMDSDRFNKENLIQTLENKDISKGLIVFINEGQNDEFILNSMKGILEFKNVQWIEGLNACNVYILK